MCSSIDNLCKDYCRLKSLEVVLIGVRQNRMQERRLTRSAYRRSGKANIFRGQKAVDLWLTRFSLVAQIGGVALALVGLFYTVIPLYQKAAVDEQLARKEYELQVVNQNLDLAKATLYQTQRNAYIRGKIPAVSAECSGVMGWLERVVDNAGKDKLGEKITISDGCALCLDGKLAEIKSSGKLNADDIRDLAATWEAVKGKVELMRANYQRDIDNLPELAKRDPTVLDPLGPFFDRMNSILSRRFLPMTEEQKRMEEKRIRQVQLNATQSRMARDFYSSANSIMLQELVPKKWAQKNSASTASEAARSGVSELDK